MTELRVHEITSASTVRLYRNAEGVIVMSEEIAPISDARIVELFDQHGETNIASLSGFFYLVRTIEHELMKRI